MANQAGAGRFRSPKRLLSAVLVAFSLVVVGIAEGSHEHDDAADSPAACAICELSHKAGPVPSSATPRLEGPTLVQAPALRGHRLNAGPVHLSPHRSRAPPLPISL
ncbi:hypothetical protein [Candidatus Palauibacter sp.]|uniref:hypothetical protein n=1 Tax=Candidatus Palauibacter sp. TaxID=3101350 RepID=UPI003B5A8A6A